MSLPRPPDRRAWWLALIFVALPLPFLSVTAAINAPDEARPYLYLLALFAAPLAACYLLAVSSLP